MIVTLYGPDSYRRIKKLNELLDSYINKRGGVSHERFSFKGEADLERVEVFLGTPSMFSTKKLVVLDDPFEHADTRGLKKILQKYTENNDTNIIINTQKKFSPSFKFLTEDPNKFEEYQELKGIELDKFIEREAKRVGLHLNREDVALIKEFGGANSWAIVTELEKITLASGRNIQEKEVGVNYFKNMNTIRGTGPISKKLVALEELLSANRLDAERIFNGLAYGVGSAEEADMYADYNVATRAGKFDYDEVLVAVALGLRFNPLDW